MPVSYSEHVCSTKKKHKKHLADCQALPYLCVRF